MSPYPIALPRLDQDLKNNHETAYVLSVEQLITIAKENKIPIAQQIGGNASVALDLHTLTKIVRDLGVRGKVVQKTVSGKTYVIFKGWPRNRRIFKGTRYLANNMKVMDMAIGKAAIKQSVRSGARLTLFFTVPLRIIEHLFKDRFLLSELFADLAYDLLTIGIAAIFSAAAAVAIGTVTTVAAAPLAIAILVGLATTWAMDKLNGKFGLTKRLAQILREFEDSTLGEFRRGLWEIEKRLRWQIMNGKPVGKGVFY
ncbi:hypothetical protein CW749_01415 [Vibrio sp. vnigr-6D03]|uniref:hypothetical protein n=1 Tax=Vibrio sp. vnigr-6D03 TaxID=2058088 RepID=UPI000C32F97E|nr:hypothetical protein [Vibrio sp. vnigr-6D03]PKF81326.1 hypothetical protein CW749_01415 [Vibrio sp. vnigr-6D03]